MAEVFKYAQGPKSMKVTEAIARHVTTQNRLDVIALRIGVDAEAILARHKHDGHAEITVERGSIDRYISLNDDRGLGAAMTIEFGRKGDTVFRKGPLKGQPVPAMEPVAPLRLAIGRAASKTGRTR